MLATNENYKELCINCQKFLEDKMAVAFSKINFVNYTKYLEQLEMRFPQLSFKQCSYGIQIDKKEELK